MLQPWLLGFMILLRVERGKFVSRDWVLITIGREDEANQWFRYLAWHGQGP
jgi:hypothetical protein